MIFAFRHLVALGSFLVLTSTLLAEVPPYSEKDLKEKAAVIVTGTVTEVKAGKETARPSGTETEFRLTVRVGKVEKGKVKEGAKRVVARGSSIHLKPGFSGSGGHYSSDTWDRITAVGKGWKLRLFLKEPRDGVYDIVFPNGFQVLDKGPGGPGK